MVVPAVEAPSQPAPADAPPTNPLVEPDTTAQVDAPTLPPTDEPTSPPSAGTEPAGEPETAPDGGEVAADDAGADTPEADQPGEGELSELDDDTLGVIAEVYGDRLVKSGPLKQIIADTVRGEVERQVSQTSQTQASDSRSGTLINQGRNAARAIAALADAAQQELGKATKGEDFNATLMKPEELVQHLSQYGSAVQLVTKEQYDSAVEAGWGTVFTEGGLPALSEEQAGELGSMVENFHRMENDPQQMGRSKAYFFSNVFKFIAARAREQGAVQERTRLGKAKTVGEKIAGKNAITAAKAKLEKERTPPAAPKSNARAPTGGATEEAYRAAKEAGDHDRAQSIVDQMAMAAGAPR